MRKKALVLLTALISTPVFAADVVNIYSFRQPFLIKPILDDFTKQTGIKTNVVFAKKGLIERVKREGKHSKADLVLTSNFSALIQLEDLNLTQKIQSDVVSANVPSTFRDSDGQWVALTKRVRNVYSSKERVGALPELTYEDLADPKYKGKLCTRSGKHPYNLGLVASMIAHHGEAEAKQWLEGVKANLARKPQGNDRAQVKAVKEGLCDIALGNSYYFGKMMQDEQQKSWAEAVHINFPNQTNRGSHINVSGVVMTKYAKNPENALKLIEYMTDNKAQNMYASVNMEYPVKNGVELSEMVASWGEFKEDSLPLDEISKYRPAALKLIDEVKFDL
ncbi:MULTISPECIES: Fe(3+) ABC transporter substrate-binding protein [unclassified Pseudoalteromonas]|jgi:iron(III) transport system substrate-binding protein|uniref:Fe(3+) ABC transporter substrate-binding protein n=1 Tax=unclassified Pseudoalteromonas TaxID=194690 RepID=UPI001023A278|nr:Fe(3+) ABC transporter substrate-binding protein [Pseudoalteromonas sp. L1]RZF92423.1 Fe(3+) ABC transporter substrate-binding protein [Pseudoalteromonas sp. CO302Y]RZG09117.1 Fe(3+) ABC transporter substrate-binding protein [Pseudoalteromonas sp. CO133X]